MKNRDQYHSLDKLFTPCGLNADWSVMAWIVRINPDKGIFILATEEYNNHGEIFRVTERIYTGEEDQFNTLFEGTAKQCIDFVTMQKYNRQQLGEIYEQVIGYNIADDSQTITADEIIKIIIEYDIEDKNKPFSKYYKL